MKNEKGKFVKDPNKSRIPRKLKKQIPKDTVYCYTPTSGMKYFKNGTYGYSIKVCPFSTYIKYEDMNPKPNWIDQEFLDEFGKNETNWCKLVKYKIDDQCKSCGLKYPKW
jgi:hypothetical protein